MTVPAYAAQLRDVFGVQTVRVIANDLTQSIQKVAVLGGDGVSFGVSLRMPAPMPT